MQTGSATIMETSDSSLTIDQTSSKAIIDWSSFSVGSGGVVQFNNGSGATLNRVTGDLGSAIDGMLSGTGSVYLINPNGVIVGKDGVVNVGGSFVASTHDHLLMFTSKGRAFSKRVYELPEGSRSARGKGPRRPRGIEHGGAAGHQGGTRVASPPYIAPPSVRAW